MVHPLSQLQFTPEHLSSQLAPEAWVQILAARVTLGPDEAAVMGTLLRANINWQTLMADSGKLGVQPLLYRHLSQSEFSGHIPSAAMASFENAYRWQSMRNLCLYGLIEQLLSAFEDIGITVVPLKGAFLARSIYPDSALRPMADIDLLCREEDEGLLRARLAEVGFHQKAGPVRAKLAELGFAKNVAYPSFFHERFFAVDKGCHLNPFYRSSSTIEVHFSIFPSVPHGFMHMKPVWDRVGLLTTDGHSSGALALDDLILYLCLHLMRHIRYGQCRLYWFCDIHEVLAQHGDAIQWERLFRTAAELGVTDQMHSIFLLLNRYWNSDVPEMQGHIKELSMATILQRQLLRNREESHKALIRTHFHKLVALLDTPGWRERIYFFWRLLFPSRENLIRRYQPQSSMRLYLSYLVHPVLAVKRAMESLFFSILYLLRK
jgi:hypothetical protein